MNKALKFAFVLIGLTVFSYLTPVSQPESDPSTVASKAPETVKESEKPPRTRTSSRSSSGIGSGGSVGPSEETTDEHEFKTVKLAETGKSRKQLEAWNAKVEAAKERALRRAKGKDRPMRLTNMKPNVDKEKIRQWFNESEESMRRFGYLETLPANEQDQILAKINGLRHDIKYGNNTVENYLELAKTHEKYHMYTQANRALYDMYQAHPKNPKALYERGMYYRRQGFRRYSEDMFKELLVVQPDHPNAQEMLDQVQNALEYLPGHEPEGAPKTKLLSGYDSYR